MKTRSTLVISLFILVMAFAILPTYAEESTTIDNATYGVNTTQTTPQLNATTSKKTYSITPYSKPYDKKILKYPTYNKYTKHYYVLISYMKKLEKSGGGTLILKKGTYTISNTIPIPSNVNLVLDGAVIKKGTKTGTRKFKASSTIFQLVKPSKLKKSKAYSKYNGVRNVKIIGRGTAVIDLRYVKNSIAIVCGHNRNIQIQGITFKNMRSGHFIEVDATNGMRISNCKFIGSKPSPLVNKEAINIDTPDKITKGFNNIWSAQDKTPNNNIIIENNLFYKLDRAIGSHKFSQFKYYGKYRTNRGMVYHNGIIIRNNRIINIRSDAIRVFNWKNSQIVNNYISDVTKNSKHYPAILVNGGVNLKIKYNYFRNVYRTIFALPAKNVGTGSIYSVTYNSFTESNLQDMKYNFAVGVTDIYVKIYPQYKVYTNYMKFSLLT